MFMATFWKEVRCKCIVKKLHHSIAVCTASNMTSIPRDLADHLQVSKFFIALHYRNTDNLNYENFTFLGPGNNWTRVGGKRNQRRFVHALQISEKTPTNEHFGKRQNHDEVL